MSLDGSGMKSGQPETFAVPVSITGAGAADPTKNYGEGVDVTHVSTGLYRFTFSDYPGALMGITWGHGETAPIAGDARLVTLDNNSFSASGLAADVLVHNPGTEAAAPALDNLETAETLLVVFWFTRYSG